MRGHPLLARAVLPDDLDAYLGRIGRVFARGGANGAGRATWGVDVQGAWFFVQRGLDAAGSAGLRRAADVALSTYHRVLVPLEYHGTTEGGDDVLAYPWMAGESLAARGPGLARFRALPPAAVVSTLDAVIDCHAALAERGFAPVGLDEANLRYDFHTGVVRLVGLEVYGRVGHPAPEGLVPGATVDERTTVFGLGRLAASLLAPAGVVEVGRGLGAGWRGGPHLATVVGAATAADPHGRYPSVASLLAVWRAGPAT